MAGAFPPLASSDFLLADRDRAIRVVIDGLSGPVTVNGTDYNGVMPGVRLSDADVANVLTYVMKSWGNNGPEVTSMDVARVRSSH